MKYNKKNSMNISKKDKRLINHAYNVANKSNMLMRHGCVIAKGKKVLCTGYNHYRSKYNDSYLNIETCSCHAEIHAIRKYINCYSRKKGLRRGNYNSKVVHRYKGT